MRPTLGCGFEGFDGKGVIRSHGSDDDYYKRTCPQFFARQAGVYSVYEYLPDYRRSALGNVLDLPNVLYEGLQILDAEHGKLEQYNEQHNQDSVQT